MNKKRLLCALMCVLLLALTLFSSAETSIAGDWVMAGYAEADSYLMLIGREAAFGWFGIYADLNVTPSGTYTYTEYYDDGDTYVERGFASVSGSNITFISNEGDYTYLKLDGDVLSMEFGTYSLLLVPAGSERIYDLNGRLISGDAPAAYTAPTTTSVSGSLAGSHWVATGMSTEMIDWMEMETDVGDFSIGDIMSFVTFVSSEQMLTSGTVLAAVYCSLDLNADGTFALTMKMSVMGQVDEDSSQTIRGTWSSSAGTLILTSEGEPVPCMLSGNSLIMGVEGMSLNFERLY